MRRFIALLSALLAFIAVAVTPTPANAATGLTQADTRAAFSQIAIDELNAAESGDLADGTITYSTDASVNEGIPALVYAFTARLEAFRNGGDWSAPAVTTYINKVLSLKTTSNTYGDEGFITGQGGVDRMGDGTTNPADTLLAVTQADHVGPMFLQAAAQMPATYGPDVDLVVDSLMAMPVMTLSAPGDAWDGDKCMAYDDSPNDAGYCMPNVSLGAAAMLQRALDAGYNGSHLTSDVQALIDSLKPLGTDMYGTNITGQGGPNPGHWWPYCWNNVANSKFPVGFTRAQKAQDWNHEAYTAESADYLGLATGEDSLNTHLHDPHYNPYYSFHPNSPDGNHVQDIAGRLRMEYLRPTYGPKNTLQEAQWDEAEYNSLNKNADLRVQLGEWAARLAGNADAQASIVYTVGSIDQLTVDGGNTHPAGAQIVLRSFVRNNVATPIVDKPTSLHLAGARTTKLDSKTTGLRGNIAYVTTMPSSGSRCFSIWTANGTKAPRVCVTVG